MNNIDMINDAEKANLKKQIDTLNESINIQNNKNTALVKEIEKLSHKPKLLLYSFYGLLIITIGLLVKIFWLK